ncbi:hypothetical protein CONPUDRAFT_128915 [Coniophora puteana RWD-64-598 SS2]|uniref:EamA domain-containing protein n=1 Tax=Coniophora puteana (strain RWD-64-598) TaxID=741705 RepID=A0A5M3MG68_CONPW|nr:uncharacterized protein CONPUDRAFT_128915 [Coniophora puteana RWD-64-598 SS2]EIW77920.1 hypothetical protein CONPUDRAFT_128915 [Coniophora puteana RWD-64-598 SS2]
MKGILKNSSSAKGYLVLSQHDNAPSPTVEIPATPGSYDDEHDGWAETPTSPEFEKAHDKDRRWYARILRRINTWADRQPRIVRLKEIADANYGMLLIMLSQFFFSFMNLGVKILNTLEKPVPTMELIIVRMVITFLCCVSYMVLRKVPDPFLGPKGVRLLLVARGLFGFFGLFGVYYSLQYLSLADATTLTFLGPLATAISGRIFLKEAYSKREACAAICSLLGVILIARPPFLFGHSELPGAGAHEGVGGETGAVLATTAQRLRAVGASLIGVCLGSLAQCAIRAIGTKAHAMHSMTFFSLWCVIVSSTSMTTLDIHMMVPQRWEWGAVLVFIGLCGFFAQTLVTIGLQRETAARGAMGVYIQVIIAGFLEYMFFGVVPTLLSLVGAGIIIACAVFIVMTKKVEKKIARIDTAVEEGLLARRDSHESGSEEGSEGEVVKLESISHEGVAQGAIQVVMRA